jgi:hypothetical protein
VKNQWFTGIVHNSARYDASTFLSRSNRLGAFKKAPLRTTDPVVVDGKQQVREREASGRKLGRWPSGAT